MRITLFAFNTDGDAARRSLACFNLEHEHSQDLDATAE
jgi:hypothetical protein